MEASVEKTMRKIVNQVGSEQVPSVWNLVSDTVKDEMISKAMEEVPDFMVNFFDEIKEDIEKYFDIKHMVVSHFVENRELLNFVFEECGADELIFIQRSGFFFGFLFGLLQTVVWIFYDAGWVLPAFGFIVGYATNFLALKVRFLMLRTDIFTHGANSHRSTLTTRDFCWQFRSSSSPWTPSSSAASHSRGFSLPVKWKCPRSSPEFVQLKCFTPRRCGAQSWMGRTPKNSQSCFARTLVTFATRWPAVLLT